MRKTWVVIWLVALGSLAACAKEPLVPTKALAKASICWRADELDGDTAALTALAPRLTGAGYSLVRTGCDLSLALTTRWVKTQGYADYREVTLNVHGGSTLVDRIHLEFEPGEMALDDPDRLAIALVNALNRSTKVTEYLAPETIPQVPADSDPIAGTRWQFCDHTDQVSFFPVGTLAFDHANCGAGRWSQTGDHVTWDCNVGSFDAHVRSGRLVGEWHRAKGTTAAGKPDHGRTCVEKAGLATPRLDATTVATIMRSNSPLFQACLDAANDPALKGCFVAKLVVSTEGRVQSVNDTAPSQIAVPNETVRQCVSNQIAKLLFPVPAAPLEAVYSIKFGKDVGSCQVVAPGVFDKEATAKALGDAASSIASCKSPGGPTGAGHITVEFAPTGHVANTVMEAPYATTPVGACVDAAFRKVVVPPFDGTSVSVGKSFNVEP